MCARKLGFIKLLHSTGVSREKIEVTWNLITTSTRYHSKLLLFLLLSIKVATTFPGSSPSRPLERGTEREREKTLVTCLPAKKNSLDGVPVFSFFITSDLPAPSSPLCYVLSSPRFLETPDQRFPGSLPLAPGDGKEGNLETRLLKLRSQ